ncbi:hypothetical protein ACFY2R_08795 [Micromonospora olivasterospora]|uniref:Uncharacterized protein n=1 Tax=Micromonospora olivasterospora TaxID=1880 RepID=A0A562I8G2_MICOL|nr:hypothetical protein [Micromonospora olivasterospora]TWH66973.1 hypothetical protein JD77_01934 [Micromonospora olivasterospora]
MALTNGAVSRYGTAAGTGTLAVLVLVAVCGSPLYVGWAEGSTDPNSTGGWFLRLLAWPAWRLGSGDSGVLATDLRAILLVVLAAALLYVLPAAQVARVQGGLSQFFSGWGAYVLAAGLAALLGTLLGPDPSLLKALQAAGAGASYGFLSGWIIGTASLGGRA